jgi:glycosyltransferase involved in cell wall biosynthesis
MRPRASVVIPTFNGAQRLPRVLAALAAQNADDESFEVIVVDNASTDDTAKVALGERATRRLRRSRYRVARGRRSTSGDNSCANTGRAGGALGASLLSR